MSDIVSAAELYCELGIDSPPTSAEESVVASAINQAEGAVVRLLRYHPLLSVRTEYYPRMDFSISARVGVWEVDDNEAYIRQLSDWSVDELQVQGIPIREFDTAGANGIDLRVDYDARSGTKSGTFAVATKKTVGTDFWPNYDLEDSNGYRVCHDGIIRSEGRWPTVPGSVKIVYVAGYTPKELRGVDDSIDASPIREAIIDEAVRRVHKKMSRRKKRSGWGTGGFTSESLGDYSYSADGAGVRELTGSGSDIMAETAMKLESFVNFGVMLAS